jgi:hypothetical protein
MSVENILGQRIKAIEQSQSDADCFKHIHAYIKHLLITPQLKAILDAEEKDFYKKVQFTKDNIKLENANFYQAYFVTSYVRIYLPIENYQNTHEPDSEQDPVALLLLYGFKHPRTQSWVKRYPSFYMRWHRKQQLKSYWSWFDGKRDEYVREIKNLHLEIITALSKPELKPQQVQPGIGLHLDLATGDFNYGNVTSSLNVKSQPYKVLSKLIIADGKTVPYLELIQCLKPKTQEVTKSDKQKLSTVIRNLKKVMGILSSQNPNDDIFYNEKQVGYRLVNKG